MSVCMMAMAPRLVLLLLLAGRASAQLSCAREEELVANLRWVREACEQEGEAFPERDEDTLVPSAVTTPCIAGLLLCCVAWLPVSGAIDSFLVSSTNSYCGSPCSGEYFRSGYTCNGREMWDASGGKTLYKWGQNWILGQSRNCWIEPNAPQLAATAPSWTNSTSPPGTRNPASA
eukprot:COSAG02_NODE_3166_length_7245_cov_4.559054_7_plen_175_part_00